MVKLDYSLLSPISLKSTGYLSDSSVELIKFLEDNNLYTVSSFLECMDENSFKVGTYSDTMNEARGLAEIFKNKYFNVPIIADMYLEGKISEMVFDLPSGDFVALGIRGITMKKSKTTIYTAINRLGFNDKERSKILSSYSNELVGKNLIDIFQAMIDNEYNNCLAINEEDRVFYNKMLFYLNYVKNKINYILRAELYARIDELVKELGSLLIQNGELDKQIEIIMGKKNELSLKMDEIREDIRILEEGVRGVR